MITLPTEKIKSTELNPKILILFGKPKCGKTTIVAHLEDALLIDVENGSNYVTAAKVIAKDFGELLEIKAALDKKYTENENKCVYKYGIIDTATGLEEMVLTFAANLYRETPMGKTFKGDDVRKLPNGAGYLYLREAFIKVIEGFRPYFEYLILLGHTKDKSINKEGKELSENALDLAGKLERIISSKADALGYIYRKKNQTIINFNGGGDSIVEARSLHLRGKEIVIAESDENNVITTHWDQIFIDD